MYINENSWRNGLILVFVTMSPGRFCLSNHGSVNLSLFLAQKCNSRLNPHSMHCSCTIMLPKEKKKKKKLPLGPRLEAFSSFLSRYNGRMMFSAMYNQSKSPPKTMKSKDPILACTPVLYFSYFLLL